MRANDAITGLALIVFASAMIAITTTFPDFPGQRYGPALFPRILASGLIVCGLILVWRGYAARQAGAPWVHMAPWLRDPWRVMNFVLVLALLLLYIVASETIGFIPLALVFLGSLFLWLRVKPLPAAIAAVVVTFAIHWFFSSMLRVPLPRGWLNTIL